MNTSSAHDRRLPCEEFYWAVLAPGELSESWLATLGFSDRAHTELGYLFEDLLPVPIEDVHAVYTPLGDGRVVACGMDRAKLAEWAGGLFSLGPDRAPDFVRQVAPELGPINLLTGPFTPAPIRAARGRVWGRAVAACVLGAVLVSVGSFRRAWWHNAQAQAHEQATSGIYQAVLPPAAGGQLPQARLLSELRTLQQTRGRDDRPQAPDLALVLADLLSVWPADQNVRTDSLIIAPTGVTLVATLESNEQAQRLAQALGRAPGLTAQTPQVTSSRQGVKVTLRMTIKEVTP